MEEIDLRELFSFFKNKIFVFFVIFIEVCLLGCLYAFFIQKPMYNSYTKVILSGENTITQTELNLNKNLVDTYAEIVKSRKVLDQVIEELSLDKTYDQLVKQLSVTAINNTEIIKITASDENPVVAKNIANVTASYFIKEVSKQYKMNNVNVLDEAILNEKPYNINIPKQLVIYMMIGFILAFGILFVIYYFDRSVKSAEQVEQKIKLPILGSVQEIGRGKKK